jgi:thiopurine S-methyltransferase
MDTNFWKERWAAGHIGFHEGKPNSMLERYADRLGTNARVLVPLCGKTEDMAFLASRGHEVVGIEVVEDAVRAFFDEHQLVPEITGDTRVRRYHAASVTLLVSDLFACTKADVGAVNALYDRAAIVALPPELRARYVSHVRALLAPASQGIIVTFVYDQTKMDGPPFSVVETELRELYAGATLEHLATQDDLPKPGSKFDELGVKAHEHAFALRL